VKKSLFASWQANFWAGLAIVLPGVISVAVLIWLFKNVANITDTLLIFLPHALTHQDHGNGPMYWYWSLVALAVAVFAIGAVGVLARNYFGKRMIEWVDGTLLRVPLLNKIYGTMKQVNDAFSTGNKSSFRTVVMVEFPRPGIYSLGFITTEQHGEIRLKTGDKIVCVFIPLTPNPTSGFLVLMPEDQVMKLEMSVADGIKYIISLGSIIPGYTPAPRPPGPGTPAGLAAVGHD
jgi:uncharacterized membrane protein